ncbi:MAG: hypothetical protein A2Y12_08725 [Planctomycetes bacterium GWF2_42_9]|nr:MAG: hypothetical protein A2Y12_08725 [Planctomycetes bacterium GWF2_42_9]HAL45481.1 hypothetical protein [Phycisphaerales bacterium]
MKSNKFFSVISVLFVSFVVLFLGGCKTSAERITELESAVTTYQDLSSTVDAQIETINTTIPALEQSLSDPNLSDDLRQQAVAALQIAQSKLKSFQDQKAKVEDAISKLQTAIVQVKEAGDIDWTAELGVYAQGAILISKFLPPPLSGYVALGATILTILSQIGRKRDKKENSLLKETKAETEKQLDEVVTAQSIAAKYSPQAAIAITEANDQVLTSGTVQKVTQILAS